MCKFIQEYGVSEVQEIMWG